MAETLGVANAQATGATLTVELALVVSLGVVNANATAPAPSLDIGGLVVSLDTGEASATVAAITSTSPYTVTLGAGTARARASQLYTALVDARGRERIAVDQPLAGSSYPFTLVGTELGNLVADAYLSYEDRECSFVRPFRIGMLYGFGTIVNDKPEGFPEATHDYDIVVLDAEDQVVFDSTELDEERVTVHYWADRLFVVEWIGDTGVCRVVTFTAWSPEDTPVPFDIYRSPDDAILDERVSEQLPRRINSIRIGLETIQGGHVILEEGYNTGLTPAAVATVGLRRRTLLNVASSPGLGTGRYSDCSDAAPYIKRINSITADERANFRLDATDCYRVEVPVTDQGGQAEMTPATLQIVNDCGPCADCNDFVRVYEAVRRLYNKYKELGQRAEAARDQYKDIVERWEEESQCRLDNKLQLQVIPVVANRAAVSIGFCNLDKPEEELPGLRLTLTIEASPTPPGGAPSLPTSPVVSLGYISGMVSPAPPPILGACDVNPTDMTNYTPIVDDAATIAWEFPRALKKHGMGVGSAVLEFPSSGSVMVTAKAYVSATLVATQSATVTVPSV